MDPVFGSIPDEPFWMGGAILKSFCLYHSVYLGITSKLCNGSCITVSSEICIFQRSIFLKRKKEIKQIAAVHLPRNAEFDKLSHLCGSSLGVLYPF